MPPLYFFEEECCAMSEHSDDAGDFMRFAMDRLTIWKAAVSGLRDMKMDPTPVDALHLAEFLAGDTLSDPPVPVILEVTEDGDDD